MLVPETEIIISRDGAELRRTTVRPGDYVIGCHAEAEINIVADGVAERHTQLTVNYHELFVEDLGSDSGTFVGGKRVTESTRLWPSQKVQIGSVVLETRKVKSVADSNQSLAPDAATVRRVLPEEFLRARKYEIGGLIAQGGMGAILDAHEATTQRTVAMKVMLSHMSESEVLRFIEEAQITSQLEHPNIVPVHELGVDEHNQVFYTMKLVQGVTLRKVLEGLHARDAATAAAYPLRRLLTVLLRVCDAMAFAHSRGVIHRDLKPDNVMMGDFGEVLVMDWGLAKILKPESGDRRAERESGARSLSDFRSPVSALSGSVRSVRAGETESFTMAGSIVGTPHYMSPEQARGESETLDEGSDIWALGAILRHVLTLEKPVPGETVDEVMENVRAGRLTRIPLRAAHCPGGRVPEALIAVTAKAQALGREDRYATVAQFRDEIDAYLGGFATKAEQAGLAKQLLLLIQRHKGIFATTAAAWLLITALAVWFVMNVRFSERRAVAGEHTANVAKAAALQEKEATRRALARSQLSLAEAAYREFDGRAMLAALESVPEDLHEGDWRYLRARSDTSHAIIAPIEGNWYVGVAAHPTQPGVFALAAHGGTIVMADAKTGQKLSSFALSARQRRGQYFRSLDFSPDGSRLIVGGLADGGVGIYEPQSGKLLIEWDARETDFVRFSRDGMRTLDISQTGELTVHDAATGRVLWVSKLIKRALFTPAGDVIASSGTTLRILDGTTGALVRELPESRQTVGNLALSPNGTSVFVAGADCTVRGIALADGRIFFEQRLMEKFGYMHLALTPDGERIVTTVAQPGGLRMARVHEVNTGVLMQTLMGGAGKIEGIAMHPLSGELIISGPDTRSWELARRPPRWKMTGTHFAGVFWGSDDVFFPTAHLCTLNADGTRTELAPGVPEEFARAHAVAAAGGIAAIGRTRIPARSDILLVKRDGTGVAATHTVGRDAELDFLRLSEDGQRLAACDSYAAITTEDTATGQRLPECESADVLNFHDLGWIGRDRLVGVGTQGARGEAAAVERIVLWDTTTGRAIANVRNPCTMLCLAIAPGGRTFAEGGEDKRVRVRDATTLEVLREFRAHDAAITALAFHPSKPILATASADLAIRLWNLDDGQIIEELVPSATAPRNLHFSPTGARLASTDNGLGLRIWELNAPATTSALTQPTPQPTPSVPSIRERAQRSARAGRWEEARSFFTEAIRLDPTGHFNWFQLAITLAQIGDRDAYRRHCHTMLVQFENTTAPEVMERCAKSSLLLPLDDADLAAAIRLAERAATAGENHDLRPYFQFARGFAQYRAGEDAAALATLAGISTLHSVLPIHVAVVQAMAQQHSGHPNEARVAIARAEQLAAEAFPKPDAGDLTSEWHDILIGRLLLREARETLGGK